MAFFRSCALYSLYLLIYLFSAAAVLLVVIRWNPEWLLLGTVIAGTLPILFFAYRYRRRLFPELYLLKECWNTVWDLIFVRGK